MRVVLTGGAGDLGQALVPKLLTSGYTPIVLDIVKPARGSCDFIQHSLLDSKGLEDAVRGADALVHIAAWHGIHEARGWKNEQDFWDLNVNGTHNLLHACHQAGIKKLVHISSSSVLKTAGNYGFTKRLAEQIVDHYHGNRSIQSITLRPRAFIPSWNRKVYPDLLSWARRFHPGAVHIDDVVQAVLKSLGRLEQDPPQESLKLIIDREPDYPADELKTWDALGPGSTFTGRYGKFLMAAEAAGMDITRKPNTMDISEARLEIGYNPVYGLGEMLHELSENLAQ